MDEIDLIVTIWGIETDPMSGVYYVLRRLCACTKNKLLVYMNYTYQDLGNPEAEAFALLVDEFHYGVLLRDRDRI
jgi:hypothetical protein